MKPMRRTLSDPPHRRVDPWVVSAPPHPATNPRRRRPPRRVSKRAAFAVAAALIVLGVGSAVAGAVVGVAALVERTGPWPVRSIAVEGTDSARAAEVRAYAEIAEGTPLFAVDVDDVAARVLEHPWIKAAVVRRAPPDTVVIEVTVRTPKALLSRPSSSAGGALYVVDEAGEVFTRLAPATTAGLASAESLSVDDEAQHLDLPILTGMHEAPDLWPKAVELLARYDAFGQSMPTLSEVAFAPGRGFDLVLQEGTRVVLGDDAPDAQLARLPAVLERLGALGLQASTIRLDDARRPERVAVRLRGEAGRPSRGGEPTPPRERG